MKRCQNICIFPCMALFFGCAVFHDLFQGFNVSIKSTALNSEHNSSRFWDPEGASACLLVKDAVNELPEWLAYHYHFLPLRYVIVLVDPTSVMNHTDVLSKFNRSLNEGRLTVIEWGRKEVNVRPVPISANAAEMTAKQHLAHRQRQVIFISRCVEKMKQVDRTWFFLHDVDEYVTVNKGATRMNHGDVGKLPPYTISDNSDMYSHTMLQEIEDSGAPLPKENDVCFPVPRLRFGALESPKSSDPSITINGISIEKNKFWTHRFNHHAQPGKFEHNFHVKSVVHASNFEGDVDNVYDPHVPFQYDGCNFSTYDDENYRKSPLIIRHYTGARASYLSHTRVTKGVAKFDTSRHVSHGYDKMYPWIKDFISIHGEQTVSSLFSTLQ